MPVYGLGLPTAFGLRDDDTEVIAALRTGSGEIYSHAINLTLPVSPFKSALGPSARRFDWARFDFHDRAQVKRTKNNAL